MSRTSVSVLDGTCETLAGRTASYGRAQSRTRSGVAIIRLA
jgi:hypothetical protein